MKSILIVSKAQSVCETIRTCYCPEYSIEVVPDKASCFVLLRKNRFEFVFIDVEFLCDRPQEKGVSHYKSGLRPFWQLFPGAEIIVLSPQNTIREAVNAVKAGASNYLPYPIDIEELKYVTESVYESLRIKSELAYHRDRFWQTDSLELIQTNSRLMQNVLDQVRSVSPTESTVLITGETGTGKGILARLIHHHSKRRGKQFISVHCGAIPETLLESELFRHEKAAFTGAIKKKLGKFEIANGGTIFLDEIATITASAQIKLLQVLQDRTFQRVGGEETLETDVRIIAASNKDLRELSDDGAFRVDLYYRLDVFPIEVPPLRERPEDIPLLVETFLRKLDKRYHKAIHGIHPAVMEALQRYRWPGNIRELENLMERAYILETSSILSPESFPTELLMSDIPWGRIPINGSLTLAQARSKGIDTIEKQYLREILSRNAGHMKRTAQVAGISPRQLRKVCKKHDIKKEEFKRNSRGHAEKLEPAFPTVSGGEF